MGVNRVFFPRRCQFFFIFLWFLRFIKCDLKTYGKSQESKIKKQKKSDTSTEEIIDLKERLSEYIPEYVLLEGNELNTGERRNMTLWQQGSGFHVLRKSCCSRTRVQWIQIFRDIKYYLYMKGRKLKAFDYFWVCEWHL